MSSIPFQLPDINMGLTEIKGAVYLDDEFLIFEVETALLGEIEQDKQIIKIEPTAIDEIHLERGVFKDKICIRPKKRDLLQIMPGRHVAELKLKMWAKHRRRAETLVEKVRGRMIKPVRKAPKTSPRPSPDPALALTKELSKACRDAAADTEAWMVAHLEVEDILNREIKDPAMYYKWPLTLLARGRTEEARRLLLWIMEHALTEQGDLKSERSGFHKVFHNYANLWLVIAALRVGETFLADTLLDFLLEQQNPRTGGLRTGVSGRDAQTEDPLSASFLGLALCERQDREGADHVLSYLQAHMAQQEDNGWFWLRTRPDGTLITTVPEEGDPKTWVIVLGEEEESYYFLGAICVFLARYLERFGDNKAVVALAQRIADLLDEAGVQALRTIWAAKVAPGCTALYVLTADPRYLKFAIPVIRAVLAGQTEEGYWLKNGNPWITVSAEQCYWLTGISKSI